MQTLTQIFAFIGLCAVGIVAAGFIYTKFFVSEEDEDFPDGY